MNERALARPVATIHGTSSGHGDLRPSARDPPDGACRSSTQNRSSVGLRTGPLPTASARSSRVSHERAETTRSPPPNTRTATFQPGHASSILVLALNDRPLPPRALGH